MLLHGRLDLFRLVDGQALVVDYKTNRLDELTPAEVVDAEYELQRLVYALACFRAGADEVEVTYVFLERPQEVVTARFGRDDAPALEERLGPPFVRSRTESFARPPASSYARAVPHSTSSAPARGSPARQRRRRSASSDGDTSGAGCRPAKPSRGVMARSYVAEARRRVGPRRGSASALIIERLEAEHPDAVIALSLPPPSSSCSYRSSSPPRPPTSPSTG